MRRLEAAVPRSARRPDQRDAQPRREETLRYIAEMAGELASIAGAARLPMLTYFLNMARVEAEMQISETATRPASRGR